MEVQSLDDPVFAGEVAFLQAVQQSDGDYVVALGLPKDYFAHFSEALEAAGGESRPIFLTLSEEARSGLARSGAESCLLGSVPAKPPAAEGVAREKAQAMLDAALEAMPSAQRRLARLSWNEDLYYIYHGQLLADLRETIEAAFPGRPVVLALRNRDPRWRILGAFFHVRLLDVRGPFRRMEVDDVALPGPAGDARNEPEAPTSDACPEDPVEALLVAIDQWAGADAQVKEAIGSLRSGVQGPVTLVCCRQGGARSLDVRGIADLVGHLRDQGRCPIFYVQGRSQAETLADCGQPFLQAEDISPWPGDGQEAFAEALAFRPWPYSEFCQAEPWRRGLQEHILSYSVAAKVASAVAEEDADVVSCNRQGTCLLDWAMARRRPRPGPTVAADANAAPAESAERPPAEALDAAALAGETAFFRAVRESPHEFLVAQGLPSGYFTHYRAALARSGLKEPPVFLLLASTSVEELTRSGAEGYAVSSLPDLPREEEIRAYERAHAAVGQALAALPEARRELVLLNADDDLQIVALTCFLAEIAGYLRKRFANRKIVLAMRNLDSSYRLIEGALSVRWLNVKGNYQSLEITDSPANEPHGPSGGVQPGQADACSDADVAGRLAELDAWAEEHWTDDHCLVRLAEASSRPGVLIHCQHPPGRFSFEALLRVGGLVARRRRRPIFLTRDEKGARAVERAGYEAIVFDALRTKGDADGQGFLESLDGLPWPYNALQKTEGWRRRARKQLRRYSAAAKVFSALQPTALMIYPYGSQPSRVTNLTAARRGLPVYEPIMMGVGGHARGFPVIDKRTIFLAYGTEGKELMEAFGVAPRQLVVTGNPRYDPLAGHKARREEYRKALLEGDGPDTTVILVATTGLMELDRLWLDDACRSARELGARLVIKPHPSLGVGPYRQWIDAGPHVAGWEGELEAAVAACDAMVTDYSSTGWEAVLYNRPLIVVNFSDTEFRYRWENEGVGVRVSDARQLHEALGSVAEGTFAPDVLECQRRITPRYNHLNDGKAADRMAAQLLRWRRPLTARIASWARRIRARRVARRLLEPGRADGSDVQ